MKQFVKTKQILTEPSDILKDYFKDVSKYNLLSAQEEKELAIKAKDGDENAKNKLIESNLRFVITLAKHYTNQGVPLVDLINSGNLGLCLALEKFDPEKGYRFLSFAGWYIRREMLREIYNTGRTIRYPVTFISKLSAVKKAYDKFINDNNREPTKDEIIELTNLTKSQYDSTQLDSSYCQSLDTPLYEDVKLQDVIPSDYREDKIDSETLLKFIDKLDDEREKKVIKEFFGIGCKERSIHDIAGDLVVCPERVRQLKKSALKKLGRYKKILGVYL